MAGTARQRALGTAGQREPGRAKDAGPGQGVLARRQRGLVLLTLLLALTLASIALAGALDVWRLQRQRQQEAQLLFVGNQYRQAIQRYYRAGRTLPTSIADLLEDNRYPVPLHHLRRAYPDPITGRNDWQFMRQGDGFFGVYSSSALPTIKRAHFPRRYADFENATTYGEWRFFYLPPALRNRLTGAALDSATLAVQNAANVNAPDVNAPNVDTPNASTPNVNTPNANTPNANTPNANTPNRSTPNARGGGPSLGHNPAALR